jgi:hypothetical protein
MHDITALLPEQTEHGVRISTIAGVLFGTDKTYGENSKVLEILDFWAPDGYDYASLEPGNVGYNVMQLARAYAARSNAGMIQGNIVDFAKPEMHDKMKKYMPVLPAFTEQNIRFGENFDPQRRAKINASIEERGLESFLDVEEIEQGRRLGTMNAHGVGQNATVREGQASEPIVNVVIFPQKAPVVNK